MEAAAPPLSMSELIIFSPVCCSLNYVSARALLLIEAVDSQHLLAMFLLAGHSTP